MKKYIYSSICTIAFALLFVFNANAQCTWQTQITDSFEYQTVCPDIIPGTTIHNTPQSYAVHSGTYSLYLNFVNCVGSTGTCAGDTVYKRSITVCRNMGVRFSAWLTTSFAGTQCNMKIVITDGNNNVLNNQASILAPYAPNWIQYNSGTVTPTTDVINFIMITNVGGGGGNDLSMDDFLMEICYPNSTATTTTGNICSNLPQYNLINFLPPNPDTTGTWAGPSVLTGGYLGTFSTATSQYGAYVYNSAYYGTGAGCPLTTDTVVVDTIAPPYPNLGSDTIICSTGSLLLNPGAFPGASYVWNTGAVTTTLSASTIFLNGDTNIYWVRITEPNGCSNTDSITVIFFNCSAIGEYNDNAFIQITPNPVNDYITLQSTNKLFDKVIIVDQFGRMVKTFALFNAQKIYTGDLAPGVYSIQFLENSRMYLSRFIKM